MANSSEDLRQSIQPYSNLPEPVSPSEASEKEILPVPNPALGTADKELYMAASSTFKGHEKEVLESVQRQRSWIHRPFPLILGILIAVIISGLIGGLIGKAIESSKPNSFGTSAPIRPSNLTNSTNPDAIVIPKTGCPDATGRTFQTAFSNVTYKLFCNVNWIGSDITSIIATSASDCVEACNNVNQYGEIDKKCLGAAFVPAFMNRTLALQMVDRPSNCFLKYATSGYPPNTGPDEVVALCLEGMCPQG